MAVRAVAASRVDVVEQDKIHCELALVWGHILAEQDKLRLSVPTRQVAKQLVIGAILFDDVDDMLNERCFARTLRHRACRGTPVDRFRCSPGKWHAVVFCNGGRIARELRFIRQINHVNCSAIGMNIAMIGAFHRGARPNPKHGAHDQLAPRRVKSKRIRIPTRWDEPEQRVTLRIQHCHTIYAAQRHIETLGRLVECQRSRCNAVHLDGEGAQGNCAGDPAAFEIHDRDRVIVGVGDEKLSASAIDREGSRVTTNFQRRCDARRSQVHNRDRSGLGDPP